MATRKYGRSVFVVNAYKFRKVYLYLPRRWTYHFGLLNGRWDSGWVRRWLK